MTDEPATTPAADRARTMIRELTEALRRAVKLVEARKRASDD